MVEMLKTASGRSFLEASHFLNGGNEEVERSEETVAAAIDNFVNFFQDDQAEKQAVFAKLADLGSLLY
eukprot:4776705-Amphidinium_carterae.1